MAKYDSLGHWLRRQPGRTLDVPFDRIAELVRGLPRSAREHRAWWANEVEGRHVQARGWMSAGWIVAEVDQTVGRVTFVRGA